MTKLYIYYVIVKETRMEDYLFHCNTTNNGHKILYLISYCQQKVYRHKITFTLMISDDKWQIRKCA